jgi:serine/threonine protein kinase
MIAFACPACARRLQVQEKYAGKQVPCPACGKPIAVPAASREPARFLAASAKLPPDPGPQPVGDDEPSLESRASAAAETSTSAVEDFSGGLTAADSLPDASAPAGGWAALLAPPQQPDEIGRLGSYRVLKVLGRGGMGVVFQAEDPGLRRPVALKALLPVLAASAGARERFFREARVAAALHHPHVVTIYQVGEDRGIPFLAMEFLEGESLAERIKREGKLPIAEVLRIGREVALGLACAHAKGLIHRDVKPGNVWLEASPPSLPLAPAEQTEAPTLSPFGEKGGSHSPLSPKGQGASSEGGSVKLLDFGLARALADDARLTQSGVPIGTPAYMAPEQARGEKVNHRADLFSLGCLLYRLCVGNPPFQGNSTLAVLNAVALETPPEPVSVNPEVPAKLSALIVQLLQKDPKCRPVSAAAVAEVLQGLQKRVLREQEGPSETMSLTAAPQGKAASGKRRRLALLCGTLAVLAGLLGAGLWAAGVFHVSTGQGDLVLESDDPDFAFAVDKGGGVTLEDRKAKRTYAVRAVPVGKDEYELEVLDKDADLAFKTSTFTVKRGGKVALRAWFERKPQGKAGGAPSEDDWFGHVAALPPEVQVVAVVVKLKELNPGFDGKVTPHIEGGVVTQFAFATDRVTNITPLRALTGLTTLSCGGSHWGKGQLADLGPLRGLRLTRLNCWATKVADLSPLAGMKLTSLDCSDTAVTNLEPLRGMALEDLNCRQSWGIQSLAPLQGMPLKRLDCSRTRVSDLAPLRGMKLDFLALTTTQVADLSPLRGMKLTTLSCKEAKVTDLSALRGMPLKCLWCDFRAERDAAILRSLEALETINDKPAAAFWKEVDASTPAKKP